MKPFKQLHYVWLLGLLLMALASSGVAQVPQLQGIGLSGDARQLDTLLVQGDSLFVIASYTSGAEWHVVGVGLNADSLDFVRLFFYPDSAPSGDPSGSILLLVPRATVVVDTFAQPHTVQFRARLPQVDLSSVRSLQLEMAVYAPDTAGLPTFSDPKTSYLQVGSVQPLNEHVDLIHATYLTFSNMPVIQGIGLSGRSAQRDTSVIEGDTLFVLASYYSAPEWHVAGVGISRDSAQYVRVYLHSDSLPFHAPLDEVTLRVDPSSIVIDSTAEPRTVRYWTLLHGVINPLIISIQLEMAIYWVDSLGSPTPSELRTSFSQVGNVPAVRNSVDALHVTYLTFRDARTFPPHIISPDSGIVLSRRFRFVYDQPEDAAPGAIWLTMSNMDTLHFEVPHTLYLSNRFAGQGKILHIDGANLFNRTEVDTVYGGNSLTHLGIYRFMLAYQDINHNPVARDTVKFIAVDLRTETPLFFEPNIGYQPADPRDSTVFVSYILPERADSVWLTFTADTISVVSDTLSPHILRLDTSLYGPGPVNFHLDGRNIGTNNPLVAESNRGAADSLVSQCIYQVTLTYGDTLGNDNVSATNRDYVWPSDHTTIPPRLISPPPPPHPSIAVNANIPVEYYLPETPLRGSVYISFQATVASQDRGSPHLVYIHTEAPGHLAFALIGTNLRYATLVDSVTGPGTSDQNNTLVDSLRYIVRVFYRDSLGNSAGQSPIVFVTFDNHTRPAQIFAPLPGDTLYQVNMPVHYNLPEAALPGSLRLVLTRTGGDPDLGSPHTLYLSNDSLGDRTIMLQPASLAATQGIDRLEGGPALAARAVYQLSLLYSDTLNNPAARTDVNGLIYPSGSAVLASGRSLGYGTIVPNTLLDPVFRLALRAVSGTSLLRRLRFTVQGSVQPTDVYAPQIHLYSSVDTVFSAADDPLVDHLTTWSGGEMVFDSFTVSLGDAETNFFVTLFYPPNADAGHTVYLSLSGPSAVDCGGDPVVADHWPIGNRDVPLSVNLTDFVTAQDTLFGALRVKWTVASETENAGFVLSRRAESEDSFSVVANWRDHAELAGRGTSPTAMRYQYTDRGLTPGREYTYRLAAESINFDRIEFADSAIGIPRIPPHDFTMGDAYPNPFNQDVNFSYIVPTTADVRIIIYDLLGREVRRLVQGHLAPAEYRARWDSRDSQGVLLPSGIYWCRMKAGTSYLKAKKLILIR